MPTNNRRIATYIPVEIDDKFQAFKQEKGVSESKALILILSEYLGVSQQVVYLSDSPLVKQVESLETKVETLNDLLCELRSELSAKVTESRLSELKSELLNELKSSLKSEFKIDSPEQLSIEIQVDPKVTKEPVKSRERGDGENILTTVQLAARLKNTKTGDITSKKSKTKDSPDTFVKWSKDRDPDGHGWEYRSESVLFHKVAQ